MYTELDMWEAATQLVQENNEDPHDILKRKAQTQADRNDVIAAASTYEQVGDYSEAIDLLGEGGWLDKLNELVEKRLTSNDEALFKKSISYFKANNNFTFAIRAAKKLGDINMLLTMYVEVQNWEDAFKIGDAHPEFSEQIYLPYGNWLALNDRYDEAQFYYTKAGRPEEAIKVLKFLAENAVIQNQYKRAAHYYHLLCRDLINNSNMSQTCDKDKYLEEWEMFNQYSEIYYAYDQVFKYIEDPFTMCQPESLMNSAKFVLVYIFNTLNPPNISKAYTLYCLAKISFRLKCFKTCRFAYEKLMQLKLPLEWQETVDLATLLMRAKPMTDPEDILPICFQCLTKNAFINPKELSCGNCSEPFVFSFFSFENIPLIQFRPKEGINDEECQKLLKMETPLDSNRVDLCNFTELDRNQNGKYSPMKLDREELIQCEPHRVFIKKFACNWVQDEYYLLKDNGTSVIMCQSCQKFFIEDEWNYQVLLSGKCPFCDCKSEISG
jgi:intraflagellar transport protein 122